MTLVWEKDKQQRSNKRSETDWDVQTFSQTDGDGPVERCSPEDPNRNQIVTQYHQQIQKFPSYHHDKTILGWIENTLYGIL